MPDSKELFAIIGEGTIFVTIVFFLLKTFVVKYIDKAVETSFEKSTLRLSNRLNRKTIAYEFLLKKEFDFYERLDPYFATLVPMVQDFVYWADEFQNKNSDYAKKKYKKLFFKYLKLIPEMKNICVMFQPYVPKDISEAIVALLRNMQLRPDLEYLSFVAKVLYGKNDESIDMNKMQEIKEKVLKSVALVEALIKNRVTELSQE